MAVGFSGLHQTGKTAQPGTLCGMDKE